MKFATIGLAASGDVIAAVPGKRITVYGLVLAGDLATTTVILRSGASGTDHLGNATEPYLVGLDGGINIGPGSIPLWQGDEGLALVATIVGDVAGLIVYDEENSDATTR